MKNFRKMSYKAFDLKLKKKLADVRAETGLFHSRLQCVIFHELMSFNGLTQETMIEIYV